MNILYNIKYLVNYEKQIILNTNIQHANKYNIRNLSQYLFNLYKKNNAFDQQKVILYYNI